MELKICHLYPDIMNLYGDAGNLICIEKRLQWRGIESSVTAVGLGEKPDFDQFDLVFIGSGREEEQRMVAADLLANKADGLKKAAGEGLCILAIGGGMELLGNYIDLPDGSRIEGVGVLDMHSIIGTERHTGNYMFTTDFGDVVAFENHSGSTHLGSVLEPLGKVVSGFGNKGNGAEGAHWKNVFASYGHGPLLPKNPALCDAIIRAALARHGEVELAPLDDSAELDAHYYMVQRLEKK